MNLLLRNLGRLFTPLRLARLVVVCAIVAPAASFAHHSVAGFYDADNLIEIEGVVKRVHWRNPHTVFEVDVTGESGEIVTWQLESGALGVLRSRGLAREFMQPGDHIRALGDASLRSDHEMFARNLLLFRSTIGAWLFDGSLDW